VDLQVVDSMAAVVVASMAVAAVTDKA